MAPLTPPANVDKWIDDYLTYLIREWEGIPDLAAEWDEWEDYDQFDFVIEWPIREDRLSQLEQWFELGLFTLEQCALYEELLRLIAQHRATLEYLISDESMRKPTVEVIGHALGAHES